MRRLRLSALGWAMATVVVLDVAGRRRWLDHQPGHEAFEIEVRTVFVALLAFAALVAWWSETVAGVVAAVAAGAIVIWAANQLETVPAVVVVVAFAAPGLVWVARSLRDRTTRRTLLGVAVVSIALVGGVTVSQAIYDAILGPTHPGSRAQTIDGSSVEWILVGNVSSDRATVTARLADDPSGPVTLLVRNASEPDRPREVVATGDTHDVVRFDLTGLEPGTRYDLGVATGEAAAVTEASFETFGTGATSFTLAAGSCARVGANGAVFDAIAELDPDLFLAVGDFHYANIERDDPAAFREVLDLTLSRPGQAALYRTTPLAYVWDDHDFGDDNADGSSPSRPAAMSVYRQYFPHYELAGAETPIYQAFTIGRARIIITDARSARSPSGQIDDADKTMLGEAQRRWFEAELLAANGVYPLIIWVNSVPWVGEAREGADDWRGYSTERAELAQFVADNEIDGLVMVSGDAHMVAIDDGTNTDYSADGGADFPLLHAGALDRPGSIKGGPYSHGVAEGGGQFGVVDVVDDGRTLTVRLEGRSWDGGEIMSHEFVIG